MPKSGANLNGSILALTASKRGPTASNYNYPKLTPREADLWSKFGPDRVPEKGFQRPKSGQKSQKTKKITKFLT